MIKAIVLTGSKGVMCVFSSASDLAKWMRENQYRFPPAEVKVPELPTGVRFMIPMQKNVQSVESLVVHYGIEVYPNSNSDSVLTTQDGVYQDKCQHCVGCIE